MDLEIIEVKKRAKEYKDIKELMTKVFPKNELFPTWLLLLLSKRKMVDFYAYYSNNQEFVGLSYVVTDNNMAFILYLAVNDKLQGKGYGSKILKTIKDKYKDKEVTLHMEYVDKNADNYEQRVKRLHFYAKNGFNETGYYLDEDIDYSILSTKENFDKNGYINILKKYSFGVYSPKIRKVISMSNI